MEKASYARSLYGICLMLCLIFNLRSRGQKCEGMNGIFSHNDEGTRLKRNLLRDVTALSLTECSLECLNDNCCRSLNYRQPSSGIRENNCELCYAVASDRSEDLVRNETFRHYEMLNPKRDVDFCCSSPCQNGGTCHSSFRNCTCPVGVGGERCTEAMDANPRKSGGKTKPEELLGSMKHPGKTCDDIKKNISNAISKEYWIKPNTTVEPFLAYCDMTTEGGGWTLVYKYTFTNYTNYYDSSNAVTPRPNWPASDANVNISTNGPQNGSDGAISFDLWEDIGNAFFVESTISDWYICREAKGRIVKNESGLINCTHTKSIVDACNGTSIPSKIEWEKYGPVLKDLNSIYSFEGSTSQAFPVHDPCNGTSRRNHKKNVRNPMGKIYLR